MRNLWNWLRKRGWLFVLLGLFAGIVLAIIPIYGTSAAKDPVIMKLASAKGVFPALKMYAADHEGHYPATLAELVPEYLVEHRYDWLYQSGLREDSPTDWIVLSSLSVDRQARWRRPARRVVVCNDGHAVEMPEEEFQRRLAAQKKVMP